MLVEGGRNEDKGKSFPSFFLTHGGHAAGHASRMRVQVSGLESLSHMDRWGQEAICDPERKRSREITTAFLQFPELSRRKGGRFVLSYSWRQRNKLCH